MDAGKLDTRVQFYKLQPTDDGYGGFTSDPVVITTLWANVEYVSGEMNTENGSRKQSKKIKIIVRNKALDSPDNYFEYYLQFPGNTSKYRVVNMFESTQDIYTTIEAISFK